MSGSSAPENICGAPVKVAERARKGNEVWHCICKLRSCTAQLKKPSGHSPWQPLTYYHKELNCVSAACPSCYPACLVGPNLSQQDTTLASGPDQCRAARLAMVEQRRKLPPMVNDRALFTRAAPFNDKSDPFYHSPSQRIGNNYSPQSMLAASILFEQFPSVRGYSAPSCACLLFTLSVLRFSLPASLNDTHRKVFDMHDNMVSA
eukprot:1143064-Pelagomonas_calceolata.AAC.3